MRTLERCCSGKHYPQIDARERLKALVALRDHLRDTFTSEDGIQRWLRDSSRYLGLPTQAAYLPHRSSPL